MAEIQKHPTTGGHSGERDKGERAAPQRTPRPMPAPKADARYTKTRKALLDAGLELLSDLSEDGINIDDIVRRAGVAKGSFYNHFPDKDALAVEIYHRLRLDMEARISAINEGVDDPARRSCRAFCTYALMAIEYPARGRLIARLISADMSPASEENRGVVADTVEALRTGRYNIPSVDAGVTMKIGLAHAVIKRLVNGADRFEAITIAQQICTLTLRGFGLDAVEAQLIAAQSADEIIRAADGLPL
jgi:AcrR family transcriptional regulator